MTDPTLDTLVADRTALGQLLASWRRAANLTQQALADALSEQLKRRVTRQAISHWESGLKMPPVDTFSCALGLCGALLKVRKLVP